MPVFLFFILKASNTGLFPNLCLRKKHNAFKLAWASVIHLLIKLCVNVCVIHTEPKISAAFTDAHVYADESISVIYGQKSLASSPMPCQKSRRACVIRKWMVCTTLGKHIAIKADCNLQLPRLVTYWSLNPGSNEVLYSIKKRLIKTKFIG